MYHIGSRSGLWWDGKSWVTTAQGLTSRRPLHATRKVNNLDGVQAATKDNEDLYQVQQ